MSVRYPLVVVFFLTFVLFLSSNHVLADCSCSIGGNGIYVIGYEFIATTCPPDPPSDNHNYTYNVYPVNCVGGTVTKYSSYGDINGSPNDLINFYTGNGYRLIRNPSGNHIIAVQNGNYPYQGTVLGLSMAGRPAGVFFTDPAEEANEICTAVSSPADQDGDGYTVCFDCNDSDPNISQNCPTCDAQRDALIASCGGEEAVDWTTWDETNCTGQCICSGDNEDTRQEAELKCLIHGGLAAYYQEECRGICQNNGPPDC